MCSRRIGRIGVFVGFALSCGAAVGGTWYVHVSVSPSGDGTSWDAAFNSIQEGIRAASDGDTVIVAKGTYSENIHFLGKNIRLRSTDPSSPDVVAGTIIDGSQADAVVSFPGAENGTCILSGFTIRNGLQMIEPGGGGIYGAHAHSAIVNNRIVDNGSLGDGGGLYACDGTIANNIISGNGTVAGGGLSTCDGTIENNIIAGNYCSSVGGGLFHCNGTIRNNAICGNESFEAGGGLYGCNGLIENNTIYGNSANRGGGLAGCRGTTRNCIIWSNTTSEGPQVYDGTGPSFSCIQDWTGGGEGNISFYPYFVDPEDGDYHLESWSPCVDAGDPISPYSNEPAPNGGRVNMGAYGNTVEAACKSLDTDADGLPDDWEQHWLTSLETNSDSDPDGDLLPNLKEYWHGLNPGAAEENLVQNLTQQKLYRSVQAALSQAGDGDEIVVYPGIYEENFRFGGKNVVLRSTDPLNPSVVARTVIDGNEAGSVVAFAGTESARCVLSGFTIQNGESDYGGGILGGSAENGTHATIEHNTITRNSASGTSAANGGGMAHCHGIIQYNTITKNSAADEGGGLYRCHGTIQGNSITGNSAAWRGGGGLCDCDGAIRHNLIAGNTAHVQGGGLLGCDGTVQNNFIIGNYGYESDGGGGGLMGCLGQIQSNIITANSTSGFGGGMCGCNGTVLGNIISANIAALGGAGLADCQATIRNNLIAGNGVTVDGGGEGNVTDFPVFLGWPRESGQWSEAPIFDETTWQTTLVNGEVSWPVNDLKGLLINPDTGQPLQFVIASNTETTINVWGDVTGFAGSGDVYDILDYRLDPDSPCVDAGDNTIDAGRFDLDGNYRCIGTKGKPGWSGRVDYVEANGSGAITLMWKGFVDMGAYECQVVGPVPETFSVQTRDSMESGDWIEVLAGNASKWTDDQPLGRKKFYRVEMK